VQPEQAARNTHPGVLPVQELTSVYLQPIRKIVRKAYAATESVFRHFPDRLLVACGGCHQLLGRLSLV